MAVFIVLWPYLLTTKLRSVIRHSLGHSNVFVYIIDRFPILPKGFHKVQRYEKPHSCHVEKSVSTFEAAGLHSYRGRIPSAGA